MATRRVHLADVAAVSGVSVSTVSYVLGGKARERGLSDATVMRVHEAADALGYVRHSSAAALRRGKTNVVVLFYEPPMDRFVERYLIHASALLSRCHYQLLAMPVLMGDERVIVTTVRPGVCDGVILGVSRELTERLYRLVPVSMLPTLVIGAQPEDPQEYDRICHEETAVIHDALKKLTRRANLRIAFASQEEHETEVLFSRRWLAYADFQRSRGHVPELLMHCEPSIPQSFDTAMEVLTRREM